MNLQERLEGVAQQYKRQRYQVTLNPRVADLPDFAKDFKVEMLATRPDGSVLICQGDQQGFRDRPGSSRLCGGHRETTWLELRPFRALAAATDESTPRRNGRI